MSPRTVRRLRINSGLTQRELGNKLRLSQVTNSHWETGRVKPSPAQVEKIKRVLGGGAASEDADSSATAAWLKKARISKDLSVYEVATKAGLTPPAIYRIERGVTRNLRESTRKRLETVLGPMPEDAVQEVSEEATVEGLGALEDFDPHSPEERPSLPGIYVLYDISERPIYVGEGENVKKRIRDHEEKFWFKQPIVDSASWIRIDNTTLRRQIETLLIKFLKSNAVINKKDVER